MRGGAIIREARRRAGLTQKELAGRLGTKQPAVARWERGDQSPSFETVVRAVRACGLDLHVSMATYDDQDDAQIALSRRMSPQDRLARNSAMLEAERWAQSVGRVTVG